MNYFEEYDDLNAVVIDSLKHLLYNRHEDIFDRLDFEDDRTYMEPLLYSYVNQNDDRWLDGIIFAYEKNRKQEIVVFSNTSGVICIPRIGYFKTGQSNSTFTLRTISQTYQLIDEAGTQVEFQFEELEMVDEDTELVKYLHPLLESLFLELGVNKDVLTTFNVYKPHTEHVRNALKMLKVLNPEIGELFKKNLKAIFLFFAPAPNSFADMKAHNMIFLSLNYWDDEAFFLDHITHEGAHVAFNTITYESKYELFNTSFQTSFAEVTKNPLEHSTVYLRFHGLFTFYEITKTLEFAHQFDMLSPKGRMEADGRFIFNLLRFKASLVPFQHAKPFKEEGQKWMDFFEKYFNQLEAKYPEYYKKYCLDEQPYDFSAKSFFKFNSLNA